MGFFSNLDVGNLMDSYQSGGFFGLGSSLIQAKYPNPAGAVPVQTQTGAAQPPRNAAPIDEPSTQLAAKPSILDTITKQPALLIGGAVAILAIVYVLARK